MEIRRLMTAVIQEQDLDTATAALQKLGLTVEHLASSGGFLGRRNATLLVGMDIGQEEMAVNALSQVCRRRVEYIATPMEGSPLPFPSPTPITVGGATIFVFDVEHYEEI